MEFAFPRVFFCPEFLRQKIRYLPDSQTRARVKRIDKYTMELYKFALDVIKRVLVIPHHTILPSYTTQSYFV